MAKQYIPGVNGLLTEPNPADSPSNTLSEAENVVIEQGGKIQARHGLNVSGSDSTDYVEVVDYYDLEPDTTVEFATQITPIDNLTGFSEITSILSFSLLDSIGFQGDSPSTEANNEFRYTLIDDVSGERSKSIVFGPGFLTFTQILNLFNAPGTDITASLINNKLTIKSSYYIQINDGSANTVFGFTPGTFSRANKIYDTLTNKILYSSFTDTDDNIFFKFIEYKNNEDEYKTGYIVKQTRNEYSTYTESSTQKFLIRNNILNNVYRFYYIDSNTTKIIKFDELPFTSISNVIVTEDRLYVQNENGLDETHIDDLFSPTYDRFFNIKWPSFPELTYTLSQSDLYQNWFKSGSKIGVRFTFYRDIGTDLEPLIYESEPSQVYEIYNNGQDSIINIQLKFNLNTVLNNVYEIYNEFTKYNNGRKFGIIIYRTKTTPISVYDKSDGLTKPQALPVEYYQCHEQIPFDTAFTTKLSGTNVQLFISEINTLSIYKKMDMRGELNKGDILSYIPSEYAESGISTSYILSEPRISAYTNSLSNTDIVPGKVIISEKGNSGNTTLSNSSLQTVLNGISSGTGIPFTTDVMSPNKTQNFAFKFINQEFETVYINSFEVNLLKATPFTDTSYNSFISTYPNSSISVEIWDYDETTNNGATNINFKTKLSSGFIDLNNTSNYYNNNNYLYADNFVYRGSSLSSTTNSWIIGFKLNQLLTLEYKKEYLVVLKFQSLYKNFIIPLQTLTDNADFRYTVRSFYWNNFDKPILRSDYLNNDIVPYYYSHKFSRREPVYGYNISSFNNLYLSNNLSSTYLASGLYLNTTTHPQTINGKVLIKDFNLALETNDDGLYYINKLLYTDKNIDGAINQNVIVPKSSIISPFKDFYLYANVKKPLTATVSVITQPLVSSELISPVTNLTYLSTFTSYTTLSKTHFSSTIASDSKFTGKSLFLDSSICKNKVVELLSNYSPTIIRLAGDNTSSGPIITMDASITTSDTYAINTYIRCTVFEKPYLTLRLISNQNKVDYVTIQTTPLYNRKGYYSLYNSNKVKDDKYLQASGTLTEMNVSVPTPSGTSRTITRENFIPGMVSGNKTNQVNPDGTHTHSASISITNSGAPIYFNKTAATITLNNIKTFNRDTFTAPGILLLQGIDASGVVTGYALFNYTSLTTSTTSSNVYTFNGINLTYYSTKNVVVTDPNTNIGNFNYLTMNLFFLKGTTENALPLYAYRTPELTEINLTNGTGLRELYNVDQFDTPVLTFLPHNDRDSSVVAIFDITGNHRFIGIDQKDSITYLDEYAWQIVKLFNIALQNAGIKAYLTKSSNAGEFNIVYPDGYSIEMINGKYDETTASVSYSGNHEFYPSINNSAFTQLSLYDATESQSLNEIQFSRRGFPEITTPSSYLKLGKANKKIIGGANNIDDYYLFKEDGIWRLTDNGSTNYNLDIPIITQYQISNNIICEFPYTIKEINNQIIFLSNTGFKSIIGGDIIDIDGPINHDIKQLISITPKDRTRAFVNESKSLYYCTLLNEVDSSLRVRSGTYVYNMKTRQWTFMTEEILDGIQDYNNRNLIAYKQKSIVADTVSQSNTSPQSSSFAYTDTFDNISKTYQINNNYTFSYPLQISNQYNNFYYLSREQHTNNIFDNAVDQYDFRSPTFSVINNAVNGWLLGKNPRINTTFITSNNGTFSITFAWINAAPSGSTQSANLHYLNFHDIKYNDFLRPVYSVQNTKVINDSVLQFFYNRRIFIRLYYRTKPTQVYEVKLKEFKILSLPYNITETQFSTNAGLRYTFEFVSDIPADFSSDITNSSGVNEPVELSGFRFEMGVPVKITFNPESGQQPDSNKVFQEYMIHTETNNKLLAMNFKTDSRASFLADDRVFEYDVNAGNRTVYRTYIPVQAARGRYLIRQVKHDVPLEKLIITGQTIVMRDTGSPRVQKDKDTN